MSSPDFTTSILVDQSPEEVFNAVTNVRGWWSEEIEGGTAQQGDLFNYHFADVHRCQVKLTEVIPGKKVVWYVVSNYFKFTKDEAEWTGTTIEFDISRQGNQTLLRMTHFGLSPEYECFEICNKAWTTYIQKSLYSLITTGTGQPNSSEKARTADEERLLAK